MNTSNIEEWNSVSFDNQMAREGLPLVVDFYAPWCGPCKILAPLLAGLADQFAGRIRFAKVNVDEAPDLAQRFEITGVPTLLLFQNGELCDEIVGVPAPRALASRLEQLAAGPSKGCVAAPGGGSCCH
jgi:thioredoxin 1